MSISSLLMFVLVFSTGALGVALVTVTLRERITVVALKDAKKLIEDLRSEVKTLTGSSSKAEGEAIGLRQTVDTLRAVVVRDQAKVDARDATQDDRIAGLERQLADALARTTTQPPVVSLPSDSTVQTGRVGVRS